MDPARVVCSPSPRRAGLPRSRVRSWLKVELTSLTYGASLRESQAWDVSASIFRQGSVTDLDGFRPCSGRPANMPPDAINLGQGFMSKHCFTACRSPPGAIRAEIGSCTDWNPPSWVRDASAKAMNSDVMSNHYSYVQSLSCPGLACLSLCIWFVYYRSYPETCLRSCRHPRGRPRLLKAISSHYSPQFENLTRENRQLRPEEIVVTAGANEGRSDNCTGLILISRRVADMALRSDRVDRNVRRSPRLFEPWRRGHLHRTLLRSIPRLHHLQRWKARLRPAAPSRGS